MYPSSIIDELRLGKIGKLLSIDSAINKQVIDSSRVSFFGLAGDEQADKVFHGGKERAILQYDSAHYKQLSDQFPNSSHLLAVGSFGENLVATGMSERNICIGDIVEAGTVILQVTQPRQPCFKLNYRFNEPTISRFSQNNCKTGWFYRVLVEGTIKKGDTIKVTKRPYPHWTIAKVQHYLYIETDNLEATRQLSNLAPLANEVKNIFVRRLESNDVEDWGTRLSGQETALGMHVVKIIKESNDVKRFYLRRTDLGTLPKFSAGSHITLQLPNGLSRAYSLCSPPINDTYQIAVKHVANGQGGSNFLHTEIQIGDKLTVSPPVNFFKMVRGAHHIFITAGIGITPFIAMIQEALSNGESFELHYCVKDMFDYAFKKELTPQLKHIHIYTREQPLNINNLLDSHKRRTNVYTCGNPDFVNLVRSSSAHWNDKNVHFENFSKQESKHPPFVVTIKETGQKITVASNTTMLNALRKSGVKINSGCETGNCGKCKVSYDGEVEHLDSILTNSERKQYMTPCISWSKSKKLIVSPLVEGI